MRNHIQSSGKTSMTHPAALVKFGVLAMTLALAPVVGAGSLYYYNGSNQQRITPEPSRSAEFAPYGQTSAARSAVAVDSWKFITMRPVIAGANALSNGSTRTSPVFREGDSPAGRLMALPGGVIVQFQPTWSDAQVSNWVATKALVVDQRLGIRGNWYVIRTAAGQASLDLANAIHESGEVVSASPNWWKETVAR